MRLGFYSEMARCHIASLRRKRADQGPPATADEIRRARQELLSMADQVDAASVVQGADFYTTSACRDLLFHVQETRLTLPEIDRFLRENGLAFVGFSVDAPTLRAYRKQHPLDPAAVDLGNWHRFELAHPDTFSGMYQFWVQKAGHAEVPVGANEGPRAPGQSRG